MERMDDGRSARRRASSAWRGVGIGILGALALGALVLGVAIASGGPAQAHGRWLRGGGHRGHFGVHDPERVRAHLELATGVALRMVDATEEQGERVQAIVAAAASDLLELAPRHREHHDELVALLSGDAVDRAAIEALRAQEIELVDAASRRLATAVADVAEALTPDQRAELAELHGAFRH